MNPTCCCPPGVTTYQGGVTSIQQEAFSLLNTQLTQRLLSPLENALGGATGLTDLQLTLDYGGRVGYTARQQLSRKHEVYATLGQVLSYPSRTPDRLPIAARSGDHDQLHVLPAKRYAVLFELDFRQHQYGPNPQRRAAALRPAGLQFCHQSDVSLTKASTLVLNETGVRTQGHLSVQM